MTKKIISSITTREEAVNGYTAAGFALIPCNINKVPLIKEWQHTKPEPTMCADDLPDTYGVVLTEDYLVVDWDPRNETEDNKNQLTRLFADLDIAIPVQTYVTKTGGDGVHVHFKKPRGIYVRTKIKGYPAIDIKSGVGAFVIGAGSKHKSGKDYTVVRGNPQSIAQCPGALLQRLQFTPVEQSTNELEPDDSSASTDLFIRYCKASMKQREKLGVPGRYVVACYGKTKCNLSKEKTLEVMEEHFNPDATGKQSLEIKVNNAFNYSQGGQGSASPEAVFTAISEATIQDAAEAYNNSKRDQWVMVMRNGKWGLDYHAINNVVYHLELMPTQYRESPLYKLFRYNEFKNQIEFADYAPWHDVNKPIPDFTDDDIGEVKFYLSAYVSNGDIDLKMCASDQLIRQAITKVARSYAYHPVKDWLELLKWDGVKRLDRVLIDYAGSPDTPYVREVGKNTFIAAVARIMKPGCKHDHMLILEGPQGIGKSTFVATLGGEHYADIPIDPKEKDTVAGMQGAWILEASEMEMLKRADVAALKRFLTVTTDKVRLSYARFPSILPRQSIFIGTVNPSPEGYFRDETGNRRFWPVACLKFDVQALKRDRDQLFAEAVARYQSGEAWHLDKPDVMAIAIAEQEKRMEIDNWQDTVKHRLAGSNLPEPLTTDNIALYALNLTAAKMGQVEKRRLCRAIRASGFEHKSAWSKDLKCYIKVWVKLESEDDL